MRAWSWPDAFPSTDRAIRRHFAALTPGALAEHARRWSPWRSYAAFHLWRQAHCPRPDRTVAHHLDHPERLTMDYLRFDAPLGAMTVLARGDSIVGACFDRPAQRRAACRRSDQRAKPLAAAGARRAARVFRRKAAPLRPTAGAGGHRVPACSLGGHRAHRAGPHGELRGACADAWERGCRARGCPGWPLEGLLAYPRTRRRAHR